MLKNSHFFLGASHYPYYTFFFYKEESELDQWRNSTLKLMTPNQILKNAFFSHLLPALT